VWHDLVTDDPATARSFYGQLFGWDYQDVQGEGVVYTTILHDGLPIGGIAPIDDVDADLPSSRWLSVLSVDDVDAAVAAVERAGGEVTMPARDNPTRGRWALLTDPQGALIVVLRSIAGDPPSLDPARLVSNRWMWNELWTDDLDASIELYGELVGYEVRASQTAAAATVQVFTRDGNARAGLNLLPWPEVRPNWLPYIKVDDAEAVAARVAQLGGTVLIPPVAELRNGTTGLMMDPSGAAFAIQEWPVAP
jgi:predicted enzyme related to lactoylglutathione lyase